MKDTMRAVVWTGPDQVETRSVPVPVPSPGEALVRVRVAGICGTDLSILKGQHPRARAPLVMGHELLGVVESLPGAGAAAGTGGGLKVGDRVTCEPLISCGVCWACTSGYRWVCQKLGLYGIDVDGGFAEYVKVAAPSLHRVPEGLNDQLAALIEPLAVAVHAVRLSSVAVGDDVVVLGGGPIGLLTAVVARRAGPARILIAEREPYRIGLARDYGFDVIDSSKVDLVAEVARLTGGKGADVTFEVAGAAETVLAAPRLTRVKGEVVVVAMPKVPLPYDIVALTFRELTVKGIRVYAPHDFDRALQIAVELAAGGPVDLTRLLSRPFALEQAAEAFAQAKEPKSAMRVIFAA